MKRDRGTDQDDELVVERYSKKPAEFAVALQSLSLDKWPADLKRLLTRKLSVQSALNLFQTNKFFASFAQNNDLWEYYLARDFPGEYAFFDGQCDLETGLISQRAKLPFYVIGGPEHPLYEIAKPILQTCHMRRMYLRIYNALQRMDSDRLSSFATRYEKARRNDATRLYTLLYALSKIRYRVFERILASQKYAKALNGDVDLKETYFTVSDREFLVRSLEEEGISEDEQYPVLVLWDVCARHYTLKTVIFSLTFDISISAASKRSMMTNSELQLATAIRDGNVSPADVNDLRTAMLLFTSPAVTLGLEKVFRNENTAWKFFFGREHVMSISDLSNTCFRTRFRFFLFLSNL